MRPKYTVKNIVDKISEEIVSNLTPLEIGKILYPSAIPVEYSCMPDEEKKEHRTRYTEEELENGQFFEVLPGKYTFIMSQKSHSVRNSN